MEADDLNPRERQIDHVLRTRERQVEAAERELAFMEGRWWAANALIDSQVRMSLAPSAESPLWRQYTVKPERILRYLTNGNKGAFISVGMIVDALDELVEQGLVTRGRAGDYWWTAAELPDEL